MESLAHPATPSSPHLSPETERLCDEYYDRAREAFDRLCPGVMNLEMTNGFLTAIACESSTAVAEDYVDITAGDAFIDDSSDKDYEEYVDLLEQQLGLIRRVLENGEVFFPLLVPDETGELKGYDWVNGFMRAAVSGPINQLMDDDERWQWFAPMLVLDVDRNPLPDEPRPPLTPEHREDAIALLSLAVREIYGYFEEHRREEAREGYLADLPEPIDPASRPELARVDRLLARLEPRGALNLEALDGFLTAVSCGPSVVPVNELAAPIFGDLDERILTKAELRELCDFIARRYSDIGETLDRGRPVAPIAHDHTADKLYAQDWTYGFHLGTRINPEGWRSLIDHQEFSTALQPIVALDRRAKDFFRSDPPPGLEDDASRKRLLSIASLSVVAIDQFFGPMRDDEDELPVAPIERVRPKQGRNEPCACGSGKKYKKCCGI